MWPFFDILPLTGTLVLGKESQHSEIIREELPWLFCIVPLLSDSDLVHNWANEFADFPPNDNDAPPLLVDSYTEDPIAKLGLYDQDKDLSG